MSDKIVPVTTSLLKSALTIDDLVREMSQFREKINESEKHAKYLSFLDDNHLSHPASKPLAEAVYNIRRAYDPVYLYKDKSFWVPNVGAGMRVATGLLPPLILLGPLLGAFVAVGAGVAVSVVSGYGNSKDTKRSEYQNYCKKVIPHAQEHLQNLTEALIRAKTELDLFDPEAPIASDKATRIMLTQKARFDTFCSQRQDRSNKLESLAQYFSIASPDIKIAQDEFYRFLKQ